jgi:hypothetical protein
MGDEPGAHDLVELGGRPFRLPGWLSSRLPDWRPPRGAGGLAAAALAVGLVAGLAGGYAAGDSARGGAASGSRPVSAAPSASSAPRTFSFAGSAALSQDTAACSVQQGRTLELGIQVTNQSTQPLTLTTARAVLPLGGLKQVTWQWATCGAIPNGLGQAANIVPPGQSTWLSAIFRVQVDCPAAAPVQFTVGYLVQGKAATASLPGFSDLGQVPYNGCPTTTTSSVSESQDRLLKGVDRWLAQREKMEG